MYRYALHLSYAFLAVVLAILLFGCSSPIPAPQPTEPSAPPMADVDSGAAPSDDAGDSGCPRVQSDGAVPLCKPRVPTSPACLAMCAPVESEDCLAACCAEGGC